MIQKAVESILDDERLVAGLMDPEATLIVNWGISQIKAVATGARAASESDVAKAIDARAAEVRAAMREIRDLVADKETLSADEVKQRVTQLMVVTGAGPTAVRPTQIDAAALADKDRLTRVEWAERLTALVSRAWGG